MSQEILPTRFEIVHPLGNQPLRIQVQARKARFQEGAAPDQENAWVYNTRYSDGAVLKNYLGPVVSVNRGHSTVITWENTPDMTRFGYALTKSWN